MSSYSFPLEEDKVLAQVLSQELENMDVSKADFTHPKVPITWLSTRVSFTEFCITEPAVHLYLLLLSMLCCIVWDRVWRLYSLIQIVDRSDIYDCTSMHKLIIVRAICIENTVWKRGFKSHYKINKLSLLCLLLACCQIVVFFVVLAWKVGNSLQGNAAYPNLLLSGTN